MIVLFVYIIHQHNLQTEIEMTFSMSVSAWRLLIKGITEWLAGYYVWIVSCHEKGHAEFAPLLSLRAPNPSLNTMANALFATCERIQSVSTLIYQTTYLVERAVLYPLLFQFVLFSSLCCKHSRLSIDCATSNRAHLYWTTLITRRSFKMDKAFL